MSDPVTFADATPRLGLPLLHAGQARKEIFVNEALEIADALLHGAIEGEADSPPGSPEDGQAWLVATGASGDWSGHDQALACFRSGQWIFAPPCDSMRICDRSTGQERFFYGSWRKATAPVEPLGGTTVDAEARTAIAELIAALRVLGLIPSE